MKPQSRLSGFSIGCLLGVAWFYHGKRLQQAVARTRIRHLAKWCGVRHIHQPMVLLI